MFPDMVNELTIEERLAHAQLMVTVASIDGELVQEELIMIEFFSEVGLLLALRDAVLVAACDGDYDKKEIRAIKKIAKIAGIKTEKISQIYQWVEDYWEVYNSSATFFQ